MLCRRFNPIIEPSPDFFGPLIFLSNVSFLSQCLFYFINGVIDFLAGDYLSFDITDKFRFLLIAISAVMAAIGFVTILKIKEISIKYLDVPLLFIVNILNIVVDMYISDFSSLVLVPSFFALVPGAFYMVRVIIWIVDIAKKRRVPEKKNAIVVVVYVLATISVLALTFINFNVDEQKPTEKEIELVDKCYEYTTKYLNGLPADETVLQEIEYITSEVTQNGVFSRSFDESKFYKNIQGGIWKGAEKLKDINRKKVYADVVALRLKTLIALKDYDDYNEFFVDNCGYLVYVDDSYYYELWANDSYSLSKQDFSAIILGFNNILKLCDNDRDRLFINSQIIDFYNKYEPDNIEIEKYYELRSEIYDNNDIDKLFESARSNRGYISEKLLIE